MAIEIIDTNTFNKFSSQSVQRSLIYQSALVSTMVLNFEKGQAIDPCVMSMPVVYVVRSGNGRMFIDDEQAQVSSGNMIVVGAGKTRSIQADSKMGVLALQLTN